MRQRMRLKARPAVRMRGRFSLIRSRRDGTNRLGTFEKVGAWLRIWTPPKDVEVPPVSKRKVAALAGVGALALGAVGAVIVPSIEHAKEVGAQKERRLEAVRERAERRRLARDQQPHRGRSSRREGRTALVRELEQAITRDARDRVRKGQLDGPILRTACDRLHVASEARLGRVLARYSCMAITSVNRSVPGYPFEVGYSFIATVYFDARSYVWCKLNLRPGERARGEAISVKLSRSCAGPYRDLL